MHEHKAMLKQMQHESFYKSGSYENSGIGIGVGWVCHKDSFADCMPIWNETNDICMVFSGEDFREINEIDKLRRKGHVFFANNASYLIHLYEELEEDFYRVLNGTFSGLIIDLRRKKISIFNDRYGLGRIYFRESTNGFYFASEAKALLHVMPELREISLAHLGEYFSFGCVLKNETLFSKIQLMPPGSAWNFMQGRDVDKKCYFSRSEWEKQTPLSVSEYYETLRDTWKRILPRYLKSNEKLAVSLTGGKDSRMIMAWSTLGAGELPCYTFSGMFRECIDARVAREIAKICKQPHRTIIVGDDFLAQFPDLAAKTVFLTDGAMDVAGAPDLYVNRMAREISAVRLTGNYGQEILRSAIAFKPMKLAKEVFSSEFLELMGNASQSYREQLQGNQVSFVEFKQLPWHHFSRLCLEMTQVTMRSPYIDNELACLAYRTPHELSNDIGPQLKLISEGNSMIGRIGTDRAKRQRGFPIISAIQSGIKEFSFKAEYAYDYGMPSWLAKIDARIRPLHVEKLFLGRHKFYHFRVWYRDRLSNYVKQILLDRKTLSRSYLCSKEIKKMVDLHMRGEGNYTLEINKIISIELLQRALIETS